MAKEKASQVKEEVEVQAADAPAAASGDAELLNAILQTMPATVERDQVEALLDNLFDEIDQNTVQFDTSLHNSINKGIDEIDALLSKQLALLLHDEGFQRLEGSWRGLHHLVHESETCATLKLKVLDATKQELKDDFKRAIEFDQSHLFKAFYTNEFGQAGGEPYAAIIGDYEFTAHPQDVKLLREISCVSAAAFAPFIAAASPALFGVDSYEDLNRIRDLESCFQGDDYIPWRSFRDHPDSKFVALTMPRVLARLPYGEATDPIQAFNFEEVVTNEVGDHLKTPHDQYCWMNAAYAYGARLTDSFAKTNWCISVVGYDSGGRVEHLPNHVVTTDEGDREQKCPTEVLIPDRRAAEISKLGVLPLVNWKRTDTAAFITSDTVMKPKKYTDPDRTANEALSTDLPYVFATSRIAHYMKEMGRRLLGAKKNRQEVEAYFNEWIAQFVVSAPDPSEETKAKYPLAEAKIEVEEDPEAPGVYNIKALLRPWLLIKELNSSLRLVARIPAENQ